MKNKFLGWWLDHYGYDSKHPETIKELVFDESYFEESNNILTDLTELTGLKKLFLEESHELIRPASSNILPDSLEELTISHCIMPPKTNLSWIIAKNLVKLNLNRLSNNDIESIPYSKLTSLKELSVYSDMLVPPKSIGSLTGLIKLDISGCGITRIPETYKNLINLKELDLSSNKLTKMPECIPYLTWLENLVISHNSIKEAMPEISWLKNLKFLDLSYNKLESLPEGIGGLSNLTRLNAEHNSLKELPEEITFLKKLEQLKLNNNRLTCLPDQIYFLKNLNHVTLEHNQLKEIPMAFIEKLIPIINTHLRDYPNPLSFGSTNNFTKDEGFYYLGGGYKLKKRSKEFNPIRMDDKNYLNN